MKHFLKRAIAYNLDCLICYSAVMLLFQWVLLSNLRDSIGITDEWFQNSVNMQLYVSLTISLPVWFYFAFFDSNKSKGTFGKRLLKLELLDNQSNRIHFGNSLVRTFLKLLPWEIAHTGIIFPTPMYFEENPDIRILTIIGLVLFLLYGLSILLDKKNQAVYDKLLGTQVIYKQ